MGDFETWTYLRKEYLPTEYHLLYDHIDKHCEKHHDFPSFDDLKLSIRHGLTRDKVFAIENISVDIDAVTLLEYLKNEYAQREILNSLDKYIDNSVLFADAQESVNELHQIVLDVEEKVDLEPQSQQKVNVKLKIHMYVLKIIVLVLISHAKYCLVVNCFVNIY